MLKDKQFWNEVEDIINDEHSDYAVLDMYFTMRTYRVLTDDELSQLPVPTGKFYYIYNRCRNKAIDVLEYKYAEYIPELESIAKDVSEVGILVSIVPIIRVFEFIKKHKEPLALFCAMGVLNAFEEYDTNDYTLVYVQSSKEALFKFIMSL